MDIKDRVVLFHLEELKQSGIDVAHINRIQLQSYVARCLLKYLLKENNINLKHMNDITKGENGKPYFKNLHLSFSISHSKNYVCVALSSHTIGIDLQFHRDHREHIAKHYFSDKEIAYVYHPNYDRKRFYQLWCSKEAITKYYGVNITDSLKHIEILLNRNRIHHGVYQNQSLMLTEIAVDDDYTCILCQGTHKVICESLSCKDLLEFL